MHRFRNTFMLAHNAHLLLGSQQDKAGSKLLHIAGMRCSKRQEAVRSDVPTQARTTDRIIVEACTEMYQP